VLVSPLSDMSRPEDSEVYMKRYDLIALSALVQGHCVRITRTCSKNDRR